MRIGIIGVGGVGGYFGGLLAQAGHDVVFVARGTHLAAIQQDGLSIDSQVKPIKGLRVHAVNDAAGEKPCDLVLIAVKLWDTDSALAAAKPLVGADTRIASLQNGIEATDKVLAAFGPEHALGGVAQIGASIGQPGLIKHAGTMARLQLGALTGERLPLLADFAAAAQQAGFDFNEPDSISRALWEKFVFLASFSGVTALTRCSIGPIMAEPKTRALYAAAVREACAVADAKGAGLAPNHAERAIDFTAKLPGHMKASMLHDLERGARLELPWLSGAVAALGAQLGVPTPTHSFIDAALTLQAG
ncbi:ketopantoate reductase family protein [Ferrovibrio sp.]|uniref:ketopantoate reductase family protein n=1 Tax=Ferrovibrio sp. TaxID=1917215 RepID=UPI0035AF740E